MKKRGKNEGSVYKLPNGKTRSQVSLGYDENGKRIRPSKVVSTKLEAVGWKDNTRRLNDQFGLNAVIDEQAAFLPGYKDWLLHIKKSKIEDPTFHTAMLNYERLIKPYFKKYNNKDITHQHIQNWLIKLEELEVGLETRRKTRQLISQYFEYIFANTDRRNPCSKTELITRKSSVILTPQDIKIKKKYLSPETLFLVLETLDKEKQHPVLKPFIYSGLFIGNRAGEIVPYQWQDINFNTGKIYILKSISRSMDFDENGKKIGKSKNKIKPPKTDDSVAVLQMPAILREVLWEWFIYRKKQEFLLGISFTAPTDYIFATDKGKLRSLYGMETLFKRFRERHNLNGLNITFRSLRQTYSNIMYAQVEKPEIVSAGLRHSNINTGLENYRDDDVTFERLTQVINGIFPPKDANFLNTKYTPKEENWNNIGKDIPTPWKKESVTLNEKKNKQSDHNDILMNLLLEHPELAGEIKALKKESESEM